MIKKSKWILSAVVIYLFFLIVYLPASQLSGRISLPKGSFVQQLSGTIWQGRASQLQVNGIPIQGLDWQLSFWSLLTGDLSLRVKAGNSRDSEEVSFNGDISLSISQPLAVQASDLDILLPTSMVLAQIPLPVPVDAGGRLRVRLDEMDYNQGCEQLIGKGEWLNAQVGGINGPVSLGNFEAKLSCRERDVLVQVTPPNSLALTAEMQLPPNLKFALSGRFKPDASLPNEVHQAAKFFGNPDNQGFYKFSF